MEQWQKCQRLHHTFNRTTGVHRQPPLAACSVKDVDRMAATTYNELLPKTLGRFAIVKVNDHTLFIKENSIRNTISLQIDTIAFGQDTSSVPSSSSFPILSRTKQPDFNETLTEYTVDRNVVRLGKEKTLRYKL